MTTFNDWVEKVWRRVYSGSIDNTINLATSIAYTNSTSITLGPTSTTAMRGNIILAIDYELMYVTSWNANTGVATVVRGYLGSTAAPHKAGTLCYVQPKYTRFDIAAALNDELLRLSSPDNGLFQVKTQTITFNPVYMGYDLGPEIADSFIDIMEVRYKIPFPTRNYPAIHSWKVLRSIGDTTTFPSGAGIVFYEGGYPGQPVYVQYSAPFGSVDYSVTNGSGGLITAGVNEFKAPYTGTFTSADIGKTLGIPGAGVGGSDFATTITGVISATDVITADGIPTAVSNAPFTYAGYSNFDVTSQTGMTKTMLDIPPLGAEIQLTLPREIKRNFMESQPDPRKAPEVPSLAVANSVQALTILYNQRVSEEAGRLSRQYTRVEAY